MGTLEWDPGALILAAPLVLGLVAAIFRLDELIGRPTGLPRLGRQLTDWDENGVPVCRDPVPTDYSVRRRKYSRTGK
jgi:hypothetical protein